MRSLPAGRSRSWLIEASLEEIPSSAGASAPIRSCPASVEAADLALGDAAGAHGLHQVVHRAGRDAVDVGLLDHRGESLLGGAPGSRKLGR
jgi:hypothetical protein